MSNSSYFCFIIDGMDILYAFSNTLDGELAPFEKKMPGVYSKEIICNRKNFFKKYGIALERIVYMNQHHSDLVTIVSEDDTTKGVYKRDGLKSDAMLTNKKNIGLCVLASDCIPLFVLDRKKEVIGVIHAGWKGLEKNIITKTIKTCITRYASSPKDIEVIINPHVCQRCYGFDISLFETESANVYFDSLGGVRKTHDRFYTDLLHVANQQLLDIGIVKKNISHAGVCTRESEKYFSYRGGDLSNNTGVIIMKS